MWRPNILGPRARLAYTVLCIVAITIAVQYARSSSSVSESDRGTIYFEVGNELWKVDSRGEHATRLALNTGSLDSPLYLSPDRRWLGYTVRSSAGSQPFMSVWIVNAVDGGPIQVSRDVPMVEMRWLVDGRLLYTEYQGFHISADGSQAEWGQGATYAFLPDTGSRELEPELAPQIADRSRCTATVAPGRNQDMAERCVPKSGSAFLRVAAIDGTNPITVAVPYAGGGALEWSADGGRLAFVNRDSHNDWQLFVWDRDSRSTRQITITDPSRGRNIVAPSWSPDSRWIAFENDENLLCAVEVETGGATCLGEFVSALGVPPAWSPDSRSVLISSNRLELSSAPSRHASWDLFVVAIPSGTITRVTNDIRVESWPSWARSVP